MVGGGRRVRLAGAAAGGGGGGAAAGLEEGRLVRVEPQQARAVGAADLVPRSAVLGALKRGRRSGVRSER